MRPPRPHMQVECAYCGKIVHKRRSDIARAKKNGLNLYCGRKCAGLSHRVNKTKAQKAEEKAAYDREYRIKNISRIKAAKHEYFKRTYDPVKAAVERKKTMARHVEYCRRPDYKKYKTEYDKKRRAEQYGAFAEAAMLVIDLNREIKQRMTNHDIKWQNQTANKRQTRAREDQDEQRGRPRQRERRASNPAAFGA